MSELCLKVKSPVQTGTWSNIFTGFKTGSGSCSFMKQLTRTCIGSILHLRKILPEDNFEDKSFEGMTLKLLKSRKGENIGFKIEQWLEGAFEALDKKYLKDLILDIRDPESDMTVEIYTITFNYNQDEGHLNSFLLRTRSINRSDYSASNTVLNTIKLLQMCHTVADSYNKLPSRIELSMKLIYNENTPADYNPSGYETWQPVEPQFPKKPLCVDIGTTNTRYHFFKFSNKCCLVDESFKVSQVRCACLSSDKTETMFPCLGCRCLVHAECFGILTFDTTKRIRFYCHLCDRKQNNFKCHDKVIMSLKSSSDRQKLALLRRILRHCNMPHVNNTTLKKMHKILGSSCPIKLMNIILNKMLEIGILMAQGKRKTYLVNKEILSNELVHYFYKVKNSTESQG